MEFVLVLLLIGAIVSIVVFLRQKKADKKKMEDAAKEAAKKAPVRLENIEYQGETLYRFVSTGTYKICGQCGCENSPESAVCVLCGEKL